MLAFLTGPAVPPLLALAVMLVVYIAMRGGHSAHGSGCGGGHGGHGGHAQAQNAQHAHSPVPDDPGHEHGASPNPVLILGGGQGANACGSGTSAAVGRDISGGSCCS